MKRKKTFSKAREYKDEKEEKSRRKKNLKKN